MRLIAPALLLLVALPAVAQQPPRPERPQAVTRLLDCRNVQDTAERLACYDREVAAFETAEREQQLVVYDREQLRQTRRSLFGIALPNLNIFGGGDDDDGVTQIQSTIRALRQDPYGKYTFTLADGARWVQLDSRELPIEPRVGQPIRIRQAAMGSYLANVNGQVAIRVRRILPAD